VLSVLVAAALASLFALAVADRTATLFRLVSLALVIGGGFGNLLDRASSGVVRDFLNLGAGPVRTGIFNVADACVTLGAFAYLLACLSVPRGWLRRWRARA